MRFATYPEIKRSKEILHKIRLEPNVKFQCLYKLIVNHPITFTLDRVTASVIYELTVVGNESILKQVVLNSLVD